MLVALLIVLKRKEQTMNNTETQKVFLLWLSGARFADMRMLPEIEELQQQGALIDLEPHHISDELVQYYQVMSGQATDTFGFFDSLVPRNYDVVEERNGRGPTPKMLPDILQAVGRSALYEESSFDALPAAVQRLTQNAAASCIAVKCRVNASIVGDRAVSLALAIKQARTWLGEAGVLMLLSERQSVPIKSFINMNRFLIELGIMELDEQEQHIQWPASLAYFVGHGQLWVNLLGRDSQGAVHPQEEYEEVRDTLIKALPSKLLDPETKLSVIERIYRKEELYSDSYLFCAPDLIVSFKPGYAPSQKSMHLAWDEQVFTKPDSNSTNQKDAQFASTSGFLLMAGPITAAGQVVAEPAPLTAVLPTLFHVLDVEYPDTTSPAIQDLFSPQYLEAHPVVHSSQGQDLSEEDEELVINRLRDLGYI